ncbi:hypothetical protein ACFOX0_20775 [Micromonospora zhanjiangensis]|uniref:Uncharacterized protein n=1 Tax=Micromonospora zhanjiangensis TaxID=1522057 RepID=A0ABV8KQD4_9ACTN
MGVQDPLHQIAERVADCIADSGYAFVEQDNIDELAVALNSFLTEAGIQTHPPQDEPHDRDMVLARPAGADLRRRGDAASDSRGSSPVVRRAGTG